MENRRSQTKFDSASSISSGKAPSPLHQSEIDSGSEQNCRVGQNFSFELKERKCAGFKAEDRKKTSELTLLSVM